MPTFASFDGPTGGVQQAGDFDDFQASAYELYSLLYLLHGVFHRHERPYHVQYRGNAGPGTSQGGNETLSGSVDCHVDFKKLPPSQHASGFLIQTGGGQWPWFQTKVSSAAIVIVF